MGIKKTTVKNLKQGLKEKSIKEKYEADKTHRANKFLNELSELQKKYDCQLGFTITVSPNKIHQFAPVAIPN